MKRRDIELENGDKFTITELGYYAYTVGIRQWREQYDKDHFIIKTVNKCFDKHMFDVPHTPLVIGDIQSKCKFSGFLTGTGIRVLDMPIKMAGSSEYKIPRELHQFDEIIAKIVSFEHHINSHVGEQYYAYLTIDQGHVPANTYQRRPGCHVDGFQGARINPKRPINRSYIAYDNTSPVFYAQKFMTDHLDERTDDFFSSFDEQSNEVYAMTFDPYQIILTNAYTVHKASLTDTRTPRTFFRLSYDTIKYDRFGNTHNPLFNYNWEMITRNTQKHLKYKPLPHPDAY